MMKVQDPLLGTVLDERYRIDSVIARGGMAMVYLGTDLRLGRVVAIKVMHAHLTTDETFVQRFERESKSAARLSHPNLVAVHDQGEDSGQVYLVMEYVESVTLRKELKHRGRLTPRQSLVVLDSVLAGLEAVHEAGMIHRDLKPDNVLLGTDGRIKLTDFGLARAVTTSTTTKTLIGTVGYVAPELVTRTGADARTDLYTLGIMFYEMLTGSQPYTDEVPIQVAYRHVHEDVPAPSEAVPGLSPRLDALVLWAASRDPEDRPSSSLAYREALAEARAELTPEELDLGIHEPLDTRLDLPILSATHEVAVTAPADLAEAPASDPIDRTDEIPFVGDDEATPASGSSAGRAEPAEAASADHASRPPVDGEAEERPERRRRKKPWVIGTAAASLALVLSVWGSVAVMEGRPTEVPGSVSGKEQADVADTLNAAGYEYQTRTEYNAAIPAGKVVDTEPAAGTELPEGSIVTIVVSQGEELFGMPEVVGTKEETARTSIEESGLSVGEVSREYSDTVDAGLVISQSQNAGTQLSKGTAVDLVISDGVAPVEVPIVTGLDYESAYGKLLNLGFKVSREDVYSDDFAKGKVASQYPSGKSEAEPGALVMLKVSKGPKPADDAKNDEKKSDEKKADEEKKAEDAKADDKKAEEK